MGLRVKAGVRARARARGRGSVGRWWGCRRGCAAM